MHKQLLWVQLYHAVSKRYPNQQVYAKGDRIVFTSSDKNSGVLNGIFGNIKQLEEQQFMVVTDSGKEILCNPKKVNFRHGYATTIYKSQGASIKDVYVLHNGAGKSRRSFGAGMLIM